MSKTGNNKLTFLVIFKLTFLVKIILTILDIKQNMIRIRQEISFEVSCFFFTLKRKEVPHGPSGHQI